jgi:hypothetical protein
MLAATREHARMISPLDAFALHFDSIALPPPPAPGQPNPFDDPFTYAGLVAASDPLGALTAWEQNAPPPPEPAPPPADDAPGFYLADDCGGRFAIEREFGIITLADDALLARESGAIHAVRMRVIEASGESYEQVLWLKITGHVPQLAGAEDLDGVTGPVLQRPAPGPLARVGWTRYAASAPAPAAPERLRDEGASFGALLAAPAPESAPRETASLALAARPPAPARESAWSALALH